MAIFYQPPEPRQANPKVLPQTQGAQPRPAGPLGGSVNALTAVGVWATLAAVPMPVQKPLNVVPLTLTYGQQPPRIDPVPRIQGRTVLATWPEANEPRLQFNNQQPERRYIVAQTLIYGSQPTPCGPLSPTEINKLVRWWDLPQQAPPALIGVAAIKGIPAAPVVLPFSPPSQSLWPQPGWLAQSASPSAAWNVPVVVQATVLAGNAPPRWVYDYWTLPVSEIQYSGSFISQNAPADQPPVDGPLAIVDLALLRSLWEPPRQEPPRPVAIAPLTLARGDVAPFARPPIIWPPLDWPSQSEENNAGWNFTPPVTSQPTPYTVQQHLIRMAWEPAFVYPESEANNAGWNVPAVVNNPTPFRPQLHVVRFTWEPLFRIPQVLIPTAAWNGLITLARAISIGDATVVLSLGLSLESPIISVNSAVSPIDSDDTA